MAMVRSWLGINTEGQELGGEAVGGRVSPQIQDEDEASSWLP